MSLGYSQNKLFQIGKDNYKTLVKYCDILVEEGYWEKPETVLKRSINEMLDLYIQAILIQLAIYCGCFNQDERNYITEIPQQNVLGLQLSEFGIEDILNQSQKIIKAPPILLQLFSLRDIEKSSSLAGIFFDALLNILLAMAYLNDYKNTKLAGFILNYFRQVKAFLNTAGKMNYKIDERYIFRKISNDELDISNELLMTSNGDFEQYKNTLLFHRDFSNTNIDIKTSRNEKLDEIKDFNRGISKVNENDTKSDQECDADVANNQQDNLNSLLGELNSLIGLDSVKTEINSLINLIKVRKLREEFNMPIMDMSYHMVYTGNPGTGKTTVARLIAKIYKELGILTEGNLVETDRSGLVAGYVGQTALKVKEVAEQAIGGVLFIDEAYALSSGIGTSDFGGEAIDTLVKIMEDHRDNFVVIVAGYRDEMQQFLKANTGLFSRFNKFIDFADYTEEELLLILNSMAKNAGFIIEEEAQLMVRDKLNGMYVRMDEDTRKQFGNARGIRNIFEKIVVNQANRIVTYQEPTKEQLSEIVNEDIYNIF